MPILEKTALCEAAQRAYRNTSLVPERRAENAVASYAQDQAIVTKHGGDLERLQKLWLAWMAAKSRCASTMVTGPANFNTRRNDKANAGEEKHGQAYFNYLERVQRPLRKPRTAESVQTRLAKLTQHHANMLAFNAAMRKGDRPAMLAVVNGDVELCDRLANPKQFGGPGFASFTLTNVREKIKRLQAIVDATQQAVATQTHAVWPTPYVVDAMAQRVYFTFNGKPDAALIALLKSRAFKWTPSKGHWGRLLTPNALAAAKSVAQAIKG